MDGWVDLGSRENPDIQENLGTGHQRERERDPRQFGREETLVATAARVFLQVWTHLLLLFVEYDAKLLSSACPSTSRNHLH